MTLPSGGMTLALVGVDGAGKTTLSRAVVDWLSWKMEVHTYYLGSKQPSWMSDWSYLFFRMGRRSHRALTRRIGESNFITRTVKAMRDSLLCSHYLFTGYDRFRRFLAGRRRAGEGAVVVYDRYPLQAPLDGPQIHRMAGNDSGWRDTFSRLERRLYRQMHLPDLLIVLEVSPQVSLQRKPDHQWETIVEKNEVLARLTTAMEKNGTEQVRIDADQPLDDVLTRVKMEIWQRLGAHHDR
jgi:thymidylate kinase